MASVTWTSINEPGSHHRGSILVMRTEVRSVAAFSIFVLYSINKPKAQTVKNLNNNDNSIPFSKPFGYI